MPSDLAFLALPGTDMVTAYDSCALGMDDYSETDLSTWGDLGVRGVSVRSLYQPVEALRALGINIDMNSEAFKALRTIIVTNYSILMLQGAYRTYVKAKEAREIALAASETAAMAVAQQWANIAIAAGAALLVGGSLGVGFFAGEKIGSGEWTFPMGDVKNPQERRSMEHALSSTGVRRRG